MSAGCERRSAVNSRSLAAKSSYRLNMAPSSKLSKLKSLLPWMRKGYKVLDRFDPSKAGEGDRRVLQQLIAHGADLSKTRHVVHYFYFPNDPARDAAEGQLRLKGYQTRHGVAAPEPNLKSLIAERHGIVNEQEIDEERAVLTEIAEAGDGDYDGWEAQLD